MKHSGTKRIETERLVLILIVLSIVLLQFGGCDCNNKNWIPRFFMTEEKMIDLRSNQIVTVLKNGDKDALKALFSKKAVDEADSLDEGIDAAFSFIQGDIVTWDYEVGTIYKSVEYGKKTILLGFSITISTDEEAYYIYVTDYNQDTINPDNEGVYMLEVSKASYTGEWGPWPDRQCAGIFILTD